MTEREPFDVADATWETPPKVKWSLMVVESGCIWCDEQSVHIHRYAPDGSVVLMPERGEFVDDGDAQ